MRNKLIKLSQVEYDLLKKARQKLIEHGINSLPNKLAAKVRQICEDGDYLPLGKMVGIVGLALIHSLKENKTR